MTASQLLDLIAPSQAESPAGVDPHHHRRPIPARRRWQQRAADLEQLSLRFVPCEWFDEADAAKRVAAWKTEVDSEEPAEVRPADLRDLPGHLRAMCTTPLLRPNQEAFLFCQLNFLKKQAADLREEVRRGRMAPTRIERCERLAAEAEQVRAHIVRANLRLAIANAKQYANAENSFDDLLSDSLLTLLEAVDHFDFSRGFRFSTYATRAVRRQLYRTIMQRRKQRERVAVCVSEEVLEGAAPRGREGQSPLAWNRLGAAIQDALATLDERSREILIERYGLGSAPGGRTLQSLADDLGVCKERVRQLEQRALKQLRQQAASLGLAEFAG